MFILKSYDKMPISLKHKKINRTETLAMTVESSSLQAHIFLVRDGYQVKYTNHDTGKDWITH